MRFSRLKLENWKNFRRIEAPLQRRAFIVGPNASGKSNLLDAVRFLADIVTVGGGFQEAVERRGGISRLRCLSARRYPDVAISVDIANGSDQPSWSYTLTFTQDNVRRPIVQKEIVKQGKTIVLSRPDALDGADPLRLRQTHLEQITANRDFREIADFFRSIRYLHLVPQLVREPDRSVGRKRDPFGGDFLEQIASTTPRIQAARLRTITSALKVAVPQLHDLQLFRDPERGTPHLRGLYRHWRPHAGWQTEEQFSDGTLRLLGFLWSLLDGTGPLLLEEPELSLHPEVIRYIPRMMARIQRRQGRQVLVSTHSPDLLRDSGIGLDEVLLLTPTESGSELSVAADDKQIGALLEGGLSVAEAVLPRSRPENVEQLALFGE